MNKTHFLAACSAVMTDEKTSATWFQTFPPYGRYPVGGTIPKADPDAVYVYDEAAADRIIANFRAAAKRSDFPGVLVDREHDSLDPKRPSDAMAWAKDIRREEDGSIWTRWEFTPTGEELWKTKTLVNRSPAFYSEKTGDGEYHPCELVSIGMTNTPHFNDLSNLAAARAAEVNTHKGEIHMKKLMVELGLDENATEDAALAACKALKKERDDALAACRKTECDAFLEQHKDKIADLAACREVYMANPEAAKKMLGACKAPEAKPQTVLGAAKAAPEIEKTKELGTCRERLAALPPAERAAFYQAHQAEIDAGE